MRLRALVLASVLIAGSASAAAQASGAKEGSTIVGTGEAAVGLFLDPWREERASDLDWPPVRALPPLEPLDEAAARRAIELDASRDAVRRARLQSR